MVLGWRGEWGIIELIIVYFLKKEIDDYCVWVIVCFYNVLFVFGFVF